MSDTFEVYAYWGPRRECADECAERLARFLRLLAVSDNSLARWFEKGYSRTGALTKQVDVTDTSSLRDLLERGRHRRDMDGEAMPELGFLIGLWNGQSENRVSGLTVGCGSYAGYGNFLKLDVPSHLLAKARSDIVREMLAATAECWEPDWAGVLSRTAKTKRWSNAKAPLVDWMLYVPWPVPEGAELPPSSSVHMVKKLGLIVAVEGGPPVPDDPAHLGRVEAVEQALQLR